MLQVVEYSMGSREWTQWTPLDTPRRVLSCARIGQGLVLGMVMVLVLVVRVLVQVSLILFISGSHSGGVG